MIESSSDQPAKILIVASNLYVHLRASTSCFLIFTLIILISTNSFCQSKEEKEVVDEGTKLYKTDLASWYGTDIFIEKFKDKQSQSAGYFSYLDGTKAVCVFYSHVEHPKIISTFTFDSTYDINTAIVDGKDREPNDVESRLMTIRQIALNEFRTDSLFKTYKDMNPNFVPIIDEKGKRVYILTGPLKQGVVVFGNDYLLTFDKSDKLQEKKALHRNIMPIEYGRQDGKVVIATMHSHSPATGNLITATDVCTLMLYEKYARWKQHVVISAKNVSLWNCERNQLTVLTKEAWDKIAIDQKVKMK